MYRNMCVGEVLQLRESVSVLTDGILISKESAITRITRGPKVRFVSVRNSYESTDIWYGFLCKYLSYAGCKPFLAPRSVNFFYSFKSYPFAPMSYSIPIPIAYQSQTRSIHSSPIANRY